MRFVAGLVAPSFLIGASPILEMSTITVVASRSRSEREVRVPKTARVAGAGVGALGAGWTAVAIAMGFAGPFGWAASLIFVGGKKRAEMRMPEAQSWC